MVERHRDPARLEALLAANQGRLRRARTEELVGYVGSLAATHCNRFCLHVGDPVEEGAEAWVREAEPWSRPPFEERDFCRGDEKSVGTVVGRLIEEHSLRGWCVVVAGYGATRWPSIGIDVSELPSLIRALRSGDRRAAFDDAWIVCQSKRWIMKVFHEGSVRLWLTA